MMAARIDQKSLLLGDLLTGLIEVGESARLAISGLAADSREVTPGTLFLAQAGLTTHGMEHLQQAVELGAVAVLAQPAGDWDRLRISRSASASRIPIIAVDTLSRLSGVIAARFFGQPSQTLRVVGVTGTNGKTSITHFVAQALSQHVRAGVIGTLGNGLVDQLAAATHTTPDAIHLQAELARQAEQRTRVVAMEVSSHALDQERVAGVSFHTAVFSNLSRDHLDYHHSMQAYAEAKAKLLRRSGLMLAVINADDEFGRDLLKQFRHQVSCVACGSGVEVERLGDHYVRMQDLQTSDRGLSFTVRSSWGDALVNSPMLGRFNAENLLLTLGVLLGWDMPLEAAVSALQGLQPVAGRMSSFGGGALPRVVIDYAHTPDALGKVLRSLREHTRGRLICVFGCGGERDRGKRPLMGAAAQQFADLVVITDDNPRREDARQIVEEILAGTQQSDAIEVRRDRAAAIRQAIAAAQRGDLVLVAGKGHEDYQLVGDMRLPFSDQEQVERALQEYSA